MAFVTQRVTGTEAEVEVEDTPPRKPRHSVRRAILAMFLVFMVWLSWSVGGALLAPGNDSVSARLAEWARNHHLGGVVLALEKLQYQANPPAVGGTPPPGVLVAPKGTPSAALQAGRSQSRQGHPDRIRLRPQLKTIAQPPLPGEGAWRSLVTLHGQPAVQAAFPRPDSAHTSYLAGVVRMSSKLLRFNLHPGFDEPGGSWPVPDWIPTGQRRGLAATWNGAFRLDDAHGGFFLDGHTAGTLVDGAASEVFHRDGTMTVGSWNREVAMAPDVVGVRQNLRLLIDNGKISPKIDTSPQFTWGATVSNAYYVFRSGVGVTANGDLVYASGDALSAHSLARLLYRAGCVRAMELDINPTWVSFMSYQAGDHPAQPTPHSLLPDYQRPADRYYEHTSRDFVTAYAR